MANEYEYSVPMYVLVPEKVICNGFYKLEKSHAHQPSVRRQHVRVGQLTGDEVERKFVIVEVTRRQEKHFVLTFQFYVFRTSFCVRKPMH